MADLTDVVCPNHPSEQAVAKCHTCFKPACQECVKKINGRDYCSVECAANDARTQQNIDKGKKGFLGKLIKPIIILAVLGGLGYGGWWAWNNKRAAIMEAKDKAAALANQAKDKVGKIDLGAKGAIEDQLKIFETAVKDGDFNAAKTVFGGSCTYIAHGSTSSKRPSAFLQMCKQNRSTDFVVHISDFKYSEKQEAYGVVAELHFITREQTGPRNRILPIRFIFKKTSDKWMMVSIKETGKLDWRR
jgi:hypothetical protein